MSPYQELKRRQEPEGTVGFDVPHALAKATYRLRDQLHSYRSPLITGDGYPPGYFGNRNPTIEEKAQATKYVYNNPWMPVRAADIEFDSQVLEAEALWEAGIRAKTDNLGSCVVELFAAIDAVIEDKGNGGATFSADPEFGRQMRQTFMGTSSSKDNPLTQKSSSAVTEIENELKKHLGRS